MEFSTTQPKIAAIAHPRQSVSKKPTFVIALSLFGIVSILTGIVSFVLAIILFSNGTMPDPAGALWIDSVYNLFLGGLILFSARSFARGQFLSIWLYFGGMMIDALYHVMMGNPLNYLFLGFGLLIIWQILQFRSELELA